MKPKVDGFEGPEKSNMEMMLLGGYAIAFLEIISIIMMYYVTT